MASKITPFLWFNDNAEEAMKFYVSVFKNSKVVGTMPGPNGTVMGCTFELDGQRITALNGGPTFQLTEAFSFYVECEDQAEVDEFWTKLTADGGQPSRCGWLKDKFGLSWQIIPKALPELLSSADRAAAGRAMQAMLKMSKIDIAEMKRAAAGA